MRNIRKRCQKTLGELFDSIVVFPRPSTVSWVEFVNVCVVKDINSGQVYEDTLCSKHERFPIYPNREYEKHWRGWNFIAAITPATVLPILTISLLLDEVTPNKVAQLLDVELDYVTTAEMWLGVFDNYIRAVPAPETDSLDYDTLGRKGGSQAVKAGLVRAKERGVQLGRPAAKYPKERILQLRKEGKTIRAIETITGVSRGSVHKILLMQTQKGKEITIKKRRAEWVKNLQAGIIRAKERGVQLGRPAGNYSKEKILHLRKEGETIRAISDVVGVSRATVNKVCLTYSNEKEDL